MLGKLLKFELKLHTRQVGFWITLAVMALFGFLLSSTDFISVSLEGGSKVKNNGAIPLALNVSIMSLLSIFFGAVFVVSGVMRDETHKSLELIHATPVSTFDMTMSRMIGVWIIVSICIIASVVGMLFGQFAPWADKETFGPFNLLYYIQPIFVYVLINALFVSGVFTAVAAITRNKSLVYVSAVGLLVLYFASAPLSGDNAPDWLMTMVDPFGANALAKTVEFWPAEEQNTVMSPILGYIGWNRLFWGGLGLLFFAGSFFRFKRGLVTRKTKRGDLSALEVRDGINLSPVTPNLSAQHTFSTFWTRLKYEYLSTVKSTAFLVLVGIAVALFGITVYGTYAFNPDPTLPTSTFMAQIVLGSLAIPTVIIMVFFGGDILWRDRVAGMHEILDATPVKNGALLSAKWAALTLVMLTLIFVGIVFGMVTQFVLSKGVTHVNPMVYLKTGLLAFGITFTFQAFLVMFIQNFAPNRIVGMLAAAAAIVGLLFFIGQLPFFHPLMDYGSVSPGSLSEMSGYQDLSRFKWFGLYWGAFALLLALISVWIYRRGLQTGILGRMRRIKDTITPVTGLIAAACVMTFIGSGFYIHKSYEDGEYRNRKQREKRTVAYEKLVKPLEDVTLPKITAVSADVDIMSSRQEAVVKGSYQLVNASDAPIKTVYVNEPSRHAEDNRRIDIEGANIITDTDLAKDLKEYSYRIFEFDPPLAPGKSTSMAFEIFYHAPKLGDGSSIRTNGTFINNFAVMPNIGIQKNYMTNPDKRRKYDLPEKEKKADRDNAEARSRHFISANSDYVDFEAKVCTDIGQIPIAPGKLRRTYEENERACRNYKAINPILNFFNFMSADFDVLEDKFEDIDLRIFYHKNHDYNVELMMDATKSALKTFTTTFGPYQYDQVRIMEFPYASFAQAFAGTIPFSENIGFVRDPGSPEDNESIDLATYVTMHEIGHQWFAHQIVPADTKGFNVLSEGLTENAAMTAYENELGWQKARRLLETRAIQAYLIGRTVDKDDEPPLALAEQQQYLDYNKASWVFWGLKQYIGEDNMQGAIRGFLEEYGSKGAPYPTTKELTDYLKEAAGPDYEQLVVDYWDRITFWDLKFGEDAVKITPNSSGGFTAELDLVIDKKIASEETGKETSVTEIDDEELSEWVEIGFYDKDPKETLGDEWTKLERIRVTQKESKVSFDLKERPNFVLIDPRRLLIERNVKDNIKELDEKLEASN